MGGLLDGLTLGGNALQAQQFGAQVSGANISSANAPGYHRNDVTLSSGGLGAGVQAPTLQRAVNQFLDQNANTQSGRAAFADDRQLGLQSVQSAVGDLTGTGLSQALGDYFAAWRQVSTRPGDDNGRVVLMGKIQTLVSRVNGAAGNLIAARSAADSQVVQGVIGANAQIEGIAQLNGAIVAAEAGGTPATDLRDQRDAAVTQLATALGTTSSVDANGQFSVLLGGVSVVSGNHANLLGTSLDSQSGLHHVMVTGTTQGPIESRITSGSVGAQLALRDQDIVASQTSLDQFAADLTAAANGVHAAGYGLDGATGRNLFTPHVTLGAASALSIDPAVAGNTRALAAATDALTVPGDGQVALQMAQLETANAAASGQQTLGETLGGMVAAVGNTVAQANANQKQQASNLQGARALVESQSGVSLQDQMLQLTRYQNGFQAATRFIQAIDQMLTALQQM